MGMGKHDEHTLGTGLGCLPIFRRYGQCETFEQCNRQPGPTPFSLDHGSPCKTAQRFFLPHSSVRSADDCATSNAAAAVQFPLPKPHLRFGCHTIARDHLSPLCDKLKTPLLYLRFLLFLLFLSLHFWVSRSDRMKRTILQFHEVMRTPG